MSALNLYEVVAHGRHELAEAQHMLLLHQEDRYGLCSCQRVWLCDVHAKYAASARYWSARLEALEPQLAASNMPTLVVPVVTP